MASGAYNATKDLREMYMANELTYVPHTYGTRKLTDMQVALLDNIPNCGYDPIEAGKAAGYKNPREAVKSLRKEIVLIVEDLIAHDSLLASKTLHDVLTSNEPIINLKEKIDVAKTILDRSGHAKKDTLEVNHTVKGGVFVLPTKQPTVIEGEYTDV